MNDTASIFTRLFLLVLACFTPSLASFASVSVEPSSQKSQHDVPAASSQVLLATPTEAMSSGEAGRWSISSAEETPTNQNQTLTFIQSPASSITLTATPTACDIIQIDTGEMYQEDDVIKCLFLLISELFFGSFRPNMLSF